MKKAISLLLALVLCLSLCACGGGNDAPETTEASTETISPEETVMTKEEMLEQAVEINIDDLVYGSLSNPVKGQVEYCNKIMLISGYITLIATDHIEIGSNYRIDIYLPVEEIVNFETGQKITVVGQTTDEVIERSQKMADMTFTTYNYQMPVAYIVEEQVPTE